MSSPLLVSDLERSLAEGRQPKCLAQGVEHYLMEIPTQAPNEVAPQSAEGETAQWDGEALLRLKRARGSGRVRLYALADGVEVGRAQDCAVALAEDGTVSKRHARLCRCTEGWQVEDLGSENGTYVARQRVGTAPVVLKDFELLQVGLHRFALAPAKELVRLLQPVGRSEAVPVSQALAELEALGSRRFRAHYCVPSFLLAYGLPRAGEPFRPDALFPLVGSGRLHVGRDPQAEVRLPDRRVSKFHARVHRTGEERSELEDLGATNPTAVDGRPLAPGERATLRPWSQVSFGPSVRGLYHSPRSLIEHLTDLRRER
ncbi:MAG: FHA domain-containing protein [Planctomycetota bacterium]|nr:MAG: FHA domain-containing protein [Planctomycetota bacterium]